jgi:uncharacterized protein YkwD
MPRRRILLLLVLGTGLLLSGCGLADGLSPSLSKSFQTPPGESMTAGEHVLALQVFDLINAEREAAGLPALLWSEDAADVAYDHCVDMRVRGYISHFNPEGLDGCRRLWEAGVNALSCAENIAHGHQTPQGVMSGLMGSPGHRANILMAGMTHVGVGVHTGAGGPWWTMDFTAQ